MGGLEIGDEVLLINLQGDATNHGNVGNYEIKEVARINYGQNTVFFTTNLDKIYGATDSNGDITGQKIMLQRVPRYRSLTVNGTLTADAWNGEKGGVMFVKVLQSTEVLGSINMDRKGYRSATYKAGESYTGPAVRQYTANGGGGAGYDYQCGGSSYTYYHTVGAGGCYGTAGQSYSRGGSRIGSGDPWAQSMVPQTNNGFSDRREDTPHITVAIGVVTTAVVRQTVAAPQAESQSSGATACPFAGRLARAPATPT